MSTKPATGLIGEAVKTWGAWLPPVAGFELAAYVDRCAAGFDSGPIWWDRRDGPRGAVTWALGCDAGRLRFRLELGWGPADLRRL